MIEFLLSKKKIEKQIRDLTNENKRLTLENNNLTDELKEQTIRLDYITPRFYETEENYRKINRQLNETIYERDTANKRNDELMKWHEVKDELIFKWWYDVVKK